MTISDSYRKTILTGLFMPMTLFILGAYNGVMQTLYRAGVINQNEVAGINYYQGLTMHGVINAIVLTTFFAVVFGHVTMSHYLKKEPPKWSYKISMVLMVAGTIIDTVLMILGKAQALVYLLCAAQKLSFILSGNIAFNCRQLDSFFWLDTGVYGMA